ncbi:MAG TPA: hypothetical protein VJ716_06845 [Gaiellaceae bacterium]|nr:hypothetical protein [Gaiellaceae bacterium]
MRALFSLVGALIAAIALVSASGAATTKAQKVTKIDVSTRAAVIHYLHSIHVKTKGAVIQRGLRNYAGGRCPGKGWTCASTRHTVVQIAKHGGANRFVCRSASCAVVQLDGASHGLYVTGRRLQSKNAPAATNTATCIKTSGLSQSCTISQSSTTKNNKAVVYENVLKNSGLVQTASATASITQQSSASGATNTACVTQVITIDGSTNLSGSKGKPITVSLEAHQSIAIAQDAPNGSNDASQSATPTGGCDSTNRLTQSQTLTSKAGGSGASSVTQNEDAASNGANLSLDIEQNQGTGTGGGFGSQTSLTNNATFTQSSDLEAVAFTTNGASVNQTQSTSVGGIVGTVNQDSNGVSTADAHQTEIQCEDADAASTPSPCSSSADTDTLPATLTQTQVGPVRKGDGTSSQTGGNDGDTFTIHQTSTQNNDTGSGQTNTVQGDCHTDGNCTDTQNTNINGTSNTNTQSGQDVNTQTTCNGSECSSTGPTTTGTLTMLPGGFSVANTDVAEFGVGGMRGGNGTGSIAVSGISAPILHAFLYWNGPTNSEDPDSNAAVTFNGTPLTGTNIGTASSNCWAFSNGQSYRADVTALVSGDGTYSLSDFVKDGVDINGAALVVFFDDGNSSDDRNVVLWNGNDSNVGFGDDPAGWNETLSGVEYPGSGPASLDLVVSDGQSFEDPALVLNESTLVPDGSIFQGDSVPPSATDGLWDIESFDITSFLSAGSNTLNLTSADPLTEPENEAGWDCLSLVVAAANVPVSASGPIIESPVNGTGLRLNPAPHVPASSRPAPRGVAGGVR